MSLLALVRGSGAQGQTHSAAASPAHIVSTIIGMAFRVAALVIVLLIIIIAIVIIVVVHTVHDNRHRVLVNLRVGQTLSSSALQLCLPRRTSLPLRVLIAQIIICVSLVVVVIENRRALRRLLYCCFTLNDGRGGVLIKFGCGTRAERVYRRDAPKPFFYLCIIFTTQKRPGYRTPPLVVALARGRRHADDVVINAAAAAE